MGESRFIQHASVCPHLSQWLIQFSQNALFIKHLPLVSVLIVIVDPLSHVRGQLMERHVLLHLLVLQTDRERQTSIIVDFVMQSVFNMLKRISC